MIVYGISNAVEGISKKTGKPYAGYFVHVGEDFADSRGFGHQVDTLFVAPDLMNPVIQSFGGLAKTVGQKIDVAYNKNGYIVGISKA